MAYVGPLTGLDQKLLAQQIIHRYLDGESIAQVAQSYGKLSTERLYEVLNQHAEDEWKQAQTAKALAEYERAKDGLDSAKDKLSLARAVNQIRTAQWELERVCRRIYGQDAQTVLGSGQVNIQINFGGSTGGSEKDILP